MPCQVCLGLDRLSEVAETTPGWRMEIKADLTPEYSLRFQSSELIESAKSGCFNCSVVLNGLNLISRNLSLFDTAQPYAGHFILQFGSPLEVEFFGQDGDKLSTIPRVQFYTLPGSGAHSEPFSIARDVAPAISVEKCSPIAKDWLESCFNHQTCVEVTSQMTNELPCRLLDLKRRDGACAPVTLVETLDNETCHSERYATLSHCWGDPQAGGIKTTKENLSCRLQNIDWDELPKTFQDAIMIVRALEIRFIWIDSLCIIQNDPLDWKRESVRMAAIYSNSYINIAATAAFDSRGGCFGTRSVKHFSPHCSVKSFPIELPEFLPGMPTIFVRPSLEQVHQRYCSGSSHYSEVLDSEIIPLLSRAWVFQERYLAPRTLHFHPSEMIMECKAGLRCECLGLDHAVPRGRRQSMDPISSGTAELLTSWLDIVEEYSRLRLSYESDRLPALTGVATVFERKINSQYLAGIWENDVARGLLWDVTRFQRIQPQKRIQRHSSAPTWSWASIVMDTEGSGIVFPNGHDDSFQVDHRFVFVDSHLPFTATDIDIMTPGNASLSLRTASIEATAHCCSLENTSPKDLTLVFEQEVEEMVLLTMTHMNTDWDWTTPDSAQSVGIVSVQCLMIGNTIATDWESEEESSYHCMLVLKPSRSDFRLYERIGVLSLPQSLEIFETLRESCFGLV